MKSILYIAFLLLKSLLELQKEFKVLLTVFFITPFFTVDIYSQQIMNSSEVKIKAPLKINWEFKTNSTILNQKIIEEICYVNTLKGIQAISLNSGKEIWSYDFPQDKCIPSVVTFSDKYAVFINYKKNNSTLILMDLSTGKEKWNLQSDKILYKPTAMLNNDYVLCINGKPEEWNELKNYFEMKLQNSNLTAFKITDGKVAWETPIEDNQSNLMKIVNNYIILSFDFSSVSPPTNKIMSIDVKNGEKKWEFNPSSLFVKVMIGGVYFGNNALYTFPQYGGNGQISRIDINTGEERWYIKKPIEQQRKFLMYDNTIYNSSNDWQSFKPTNGDKLLSKSLIKSSFLSGVGEFLTNFAIGAFSGLLGSSFTGIMISSQVLVLMSIESLLDEKEGSEPKFIPTIFLFDGLQTEDVVNDRGLFSAVRKKDEVHFILNRFNEDIDEKELKFPDNETDLCLSNGTNVSSIFASSKGKIYSISIKDCSIEWKKDFSNGVKEVSLGLILNKDKMYLFTDKKICQLMSE